MMARHALVLGAFAACIVGCTSPTGGAGSGGGMATASFKGAKIRVLNLSSGPAQASLNGQALGNPVSVEEATTFKLTAFKKPGRVNVGPHDFSVPLKGSTAFTVVYIGTDKPTIITGEPTEVAGGKSIVYFHSLIDGGTGQSVSLRPGVGSETEVAFAKSKEVPPGSYKATVQVAAGKEATITVDLAAGNAITILLLGTSSAPRLIVLANDTRMTIGSSSGFDQAG